MKSGCLFQVYQKRLTEIELLLQERLFPSELFVIKEEAVWKDDNCPFRVNAVGHFYIYMYEFKSQLRRFIDFS